MRPPGPPPLPRAPTIGVVVSSLQPEPRLRASVARVVSPRQRSFGQPRFWPVSGPAEHRPRREPVTTPDITRI